MKLHLPVTLLAVLVAASNIVQASDPIRPQVIITANEDIKISENEVVEEQLLVEQAGTTSAPQAIVKDGAGTLVIDQDMNLTNTLVVREGEVQMSNANITNTNQDIVNLSVGGNNATLTMINSSYSRYITNGSGYSSCIALGSGDGKATVSMDKSTMHTDHVIFIGGKGTVYEGSPAHVLPTYDDTTGDTVYNSSDYQGQSEITLDNGSKMSAGTQIYIDNAKVTLKGSSTMNDQTRGVNPWYASMLGTNSGCVTELNIEGGSTATFNHGIQTGTGANAQVTINVDGEGSVLNLKDGSDGTYSYGSYIGLGSYDSVAEDYVSNGSTTSINIKNKGQAIIETMDIGYTSSAEMIIDDSSSASATTVWVEKSGHIDNSGDFGVNTLEVWGGSVVNSGNINVEGEDASLSIYSGSVENAGSIGIDVVLTGGQLTAAAGSSFTNIYAQSGVLNIEGAVTLSGELQLGTIISTLSTEGTENTITINFSGESAKITATDGVTLGTGVVLNVEVADVNAVEGESFTLFSENTTITGLENTEIIFTDGEKTVLAEVSADGGSVTVNSTTVIPEPTTATLSLLALAALAARRRR